MRVAILLSAAVVILVAGCCGYSTRSLLRSDLQRVAVLPVENSTAQPGLGDEMTETLAAAFTADRSLKVTALEAADLAVAVKLTSYSRTAAAYSGDETVTAYEVSVGAGIASEDRGRGEDYYTGTLSARVTYEPAEESEDAATTRCLAALADDIVRAIITRW